MRATHGAASLLLMGQFISNELERDLDFLALCRFVLLPYNKVSLGCSLDVTADCIRGRMWRLASRSLNFHMHFATTTLFFLASTKANCSYVFLALFHQLLSFHYSSPSSFVLFIIMRSLSLQLLHIEDLSEQRRPPYEAGKASKMAFVPPYRSSCVSI